MYHIEAKTLVATVLRWELSTWAYPKRAQIYSLLVDCKFVTYSRYTYLYILGSNLTAI